MKPPNPVFPFFPQRADLFCLHSLVKDKRIRALPFKMKARHLDGRQNIQKEDCVFKQAIKQES